MCVQCAQPIPEITVSIFMFPCYFFKYLPIVKSVADVTEKV